MKQCLLCTLLLIVCELLLAAAPLTDTVVLAARNFISLPRQKVSFSFADSKRISVDYGPVSAPGQKVFGTIVPYGKIWATGTGQATSLSTNVSLQIENIVVHPGRYSMYLLPSGDDWILILNQKIGQPADRYSVGYDYARIRLKKRLLAQPVDPFSIVFTTHGPGAGAMKFRWADTEVWVNFQEQLVSGEQEDDAS
jgi:hypothetical protein